MTIETSIIVPTYKECSNLGPLTERIFKALQSSLLDKSTEVIIVDDNSNDGSVEAVSKLSARGYNVRIIVRKTERGLSSAVLAGFSAAAATTNLICMDADLQHPLKKADFVIGTRYAGGDAIDKEWPLYRRIISGGARLLARPLTPLSDPMTGFFGIRKRAFEKARASINPIGFKICLEMYVKAAITRHEEVGIVFGVRTAGESKLSSKVILGYLMHLLELYWSSMPWFLGILFVLGLSALYGLWSLI